MPGWWHAFASSVSFVFAGVLVAEWQASILIQISWLKTRVEARVGCSKCLSRYNESQCLKALLKMEVASEPQCQWPLWSSCEPLSTSQKSSEERDGGTPWKGRDVGMSAWSKLQETWEANLLWGNTKRCRPTYGEVDLLKGGFSWIVNSAIWVIHKKLGGLNKEFDLENWENKYKEWLRGLTDNEK